MNRDGVDIEFQRIIERAIEEANRIKCPISDYKHNLRSWKQEIDVAIEAAESDDEEEEE